MSRRCQKENADDGFSIMQLAMFLFGVIMVVGSFGGFVYTIDLLSS